MKIAWVDEDIDIIEPVIQPLEQSGYEIIPIRTLRDALDSIDVFRTCDLVLLDMILPPGNSGESWGNYAGISFLQKLRQEHKIATSVIVFSVVDPDRVKKRLAALDVAGYVRKPALPSELKEAVDAVLEA